MKYKVSTTTVYEYEIEASKLGKYAFKENIEYKVVGLFSGMTWEGVDSTLRCEGVFWNAKPFTYRKQASDLEEALAQMEGDFEYGGWEYIEVSFRDENGSFIMVEFDDEGGDE